MDTVIINYGHGDITYKIISGTAYHLDTPEQVISILENNRNNNNKQRIRIFYGNTETGEDWCEEYDIMGYVGRSTGSIKIPILLNNISSAGGAGILDHCIVKITIDKKTIYQHPKYHISKMTIKECTNEYLLKSGYKYAVYIKDEVHANFKNEIRAKSYIQFLQGMKNVM
jgi:hypothetical protein